VSKRFIARLKRELKLYGITHDQVAAAAIVHRTTVVNTLAGRMRSQNVVGAAERLLAEAKARQAEPVPA
jgi:hypothetical protein